VKRRYVCGTCHAPVTLKAGLGKQRRHFAHVAGEADPECHEYFPSTVTYSGRRVPAEDSAEATETWDRGDLFFDLTSSGPWLYLWIPAAAGTGQWSGAVEIEGHRVSRRLNLQHLQRGQLVGFNLVEGRWLVSLSGEVSTDYASRLDIGPNSLESCRNLFDAVYSPGRRLGPSHVLRLGDAVWVVTRDSNFACHTAARLVNCETRTSAGGWHVFYIDLPESGSSEEIHQLAHWLERRIRPPRVRVWVERPWPCAYTEDGIAIYPRIASEFVIHAEDPVDLAIRAVGGAATAHAEQARELIWREPQVGRWHIEVNGQRFVSIEISDRIPQARGALSVVLDEGEPCDLFVGQKLLTEKVQGGRPPKSIALQWSHPSVKALIRTDESLGGATVEEGNDRLMLRPPAVAVSAGNLGFLRWPQEPAASRSPEADRVQELYPRVKWLLTVALPLGSSWGASFSVPRHLHTDPVIGALAARRWPPMLYPQLRSLHAELEKTS